MSPEKEWASLGRARREEAVDGRNGLCGGIVRFEGLNGERGYERTRRSTRIPTGSNQGEISRFRPLSARGAEMSGYACSGRGGMLKRSSIKLSL